MTKPYKITLLTVLSALAIFISNYSNAAEAWPAETTAQATDLTSLDADFQVDLSGAHWNPITRTLWVCANGGTPSAKFWALKEDGAGGFKIDENSGVAAEWEFDADLEGITQVDYSQPHVYLMQERSNIIRQFDVSAFGVVTSLHAWDLTAHVGANHNKGPEGITFVPDSWLQRSGFVNQAGEPYTSQKGMGGLMFVAREKGGALFVFDLNPNDDTDILLVGEYETSQNQNAGLEFDRSNGILYILHNTGPNYIELTDLTSSASGNKRKFNTMLEYLGPNNSNLEGFALTPNDSNEKWTFITDDGNTTNALMWFKQFSPEVPSGSSNGDNGDGGGGGINPLLLLWGLLISIYRIKK